MLKLEKKKKKKNYHKLKIEFLFLFKISAKVILFKKLKMISYKIKNNNQLNPKKKLMK